MPTPDEPESGAHAAAPDPSSPPDQPPTSPSEEDADGPGVTERRIVHIVGLMARFEFRRGVTAQQLADTWGLSLGYVHNLTAEASKRVRAQFTDPNALAADVVPGMLTAFHDAVDAKDARGVAALAAQLLEIGGLKVTKTEVTGKGGGPLQVQQTGVVILPPLDPEGSCPPVDDDDAAADVVDPERGPAVSVPGIDGV